MTQTGDGPEVVSSGWAFPECPRWHEGRLWFSDVYAGQVVCLDVATGETEVMADYDGHPGGLGFLPDGRLLIADGGSRRVLCREPDGRLTEFADLTSIATHTLNDMVVDSRGMAYVGNYGDDSAPPAPPFPAQLALVRPDGSTEAVASDMMFANGMAMVDGGSVLLVAETRSTPGRLSAFDVGPDGSLSDRRTFVEFDQTVFPDGIATTADDDVWVASPFSNEVIHVSAQGQVIERVEVAHPYAVAVGGPSGDELFVCSAPTWVPEQALASREGAILRLRA